MDEYAIYLRKSRADLESERQGQGETLAHHRRTLLELASQRGYTIGHIYEEIVSGDTIEDRPQMRNLLRDVENGMWDGVLVMDIDRLGRGDSIDQGVIMRAFKLSGTQIITPYQIYNLSSDGADEEFLEMKQSFARMEYRAIKRRMWAGRVATAKEGKWQSPKAPFGYRRKKLEHEKGWTLEIEPNEAEAIKLMFSLYAYGDETGRPVGTVMIADRLNKLGYKPQEAPFFKAYSVRSMLLNPAYIGKVRWCNRRSVKMIEDGKPVTKRKKNESVLICDGRHPAIIDAETWHIVQDKLNTHESHKKNGKWLVNPLAGLLYCSECGYSMKLSVEYNRSNHSVYKCQTHGCKCSSIDAAIVQNAVIETLRSWIENDEQLDLRSNENVRNYDNEKKALSNQKSVVSGQRSKLFDLLEQGIYDTETYLARSKELASRLDEIEKELKRIDDAESAQNQSISSIVPQVRTVLGILEETNDNSSKNMLLKTVISKIIYHKTKRAQRNTNSADLLTLEVFPKII